MRREVVFLAAVLISANVSASSYAQQPPGFKQGEGGTEVPEKQTSRWRPGVQGGLNVSDYSNVPSTQSSSRVGYILGLQMEFRATPVWFFQQEVRFVQKGFTYNLNSGGSITNFDARVQYVEIPFLVKAKLFPGYLIQPYLFAGPNVGFKLGDNVDVTSGGNFISGPPLQVLFKTVDFAIDSGVGAEYHFAQRMSGFLQFRASIGLVNVSELPGTDWKSRGYQFTFGGFFDLF